ncbi:MAG: Competence protein PilM [Parcubacteria group bacterium GW2011_GWB1_41_6]|nr:MAG: Competence protein PilM [Parcubacteria group bacterium GW2011_GWB1_41_6]KKS34132.1 MAG: Competence protein PilM [Parcubacteria group bacterium GW2011_GWC2_42_13]
MDMEVLKRIFSPGKFDFFKKKDESFLGIDIGSSSVKIVQLKKKNEQAILETYGELSVGPYAGVETGQASHIVEDKAIEMLKDLTKEAGAKAQKAAVAVPLRSSFVTVIRLPVSPERNLDEAINFEARRYIPVSMSEVVFDWWVLPKEFEDEEAQTFAKEEGKSPVEQKIGQPGTEVLITAVHKDIIEKHKKVVAGAGLEAVLFEIEIFSGVRSVLGSEIAPVLVIDLGASTTKMTVVDHGIARFAYSLDRGSQDITIALAHSLNISFSRAEEMKREIGFSSRPEYKEAAAVIEPLLDLIFMEARRTIADYRRRRNRVIDHVILTGGGALLNGVVDFAVNKIGIETVLADPFSKVEHPSFLRPVLKEAGPSFSNVLGLALRGLK